MSGVRPLAEGTTDDSAMDMRAGTGAGRSHRRVVATTCRAHGSAGFTNLLVTKEAGTIVLNPHIANCCLLRLDEQAARALLDILREWLG